MNMIEKVANIIFPEITTLSDKENNPIAWKMALRIAKAAIEAMKEPSLFMLDDADGFIPRQEAKIIYKRMIDAALKEAE